MHASWRFLVENFEDSAPDLSYGSVLAVPTRDNVVAHIKQAGRDDVVERFRSSLIGQHLHARRTSAVPKMGRLSAIDFADAAITNLDGLQNLFLTPGQKVTKRMYLKSQNTRTTLEAALHIWDDGSSEPTQMVRRAYSGARYSRPGVRGDGRGEIAKVFSIIDADFRAVTDAIRSYDFGVSAFGMDADRANHPAIVVADICEKSARSLTATERAQWMLVHYHTKTSNGVTTAEITAAVRDGIKNDIDPIAFVTAFDNSVPVSMIVPMLEYGIDYNLIKEMVGAS